MADDPLIVFGGTFDPPHYGHLHAAECARVQLGATKVLFVIAGDPYHKRLGSEVAFPSQVAGREDAVTPAAHRLAMLRLAVGGDASFTVTEQELHREGPSFTVETLESLASELGGKQKLVLLLGGDSLADFWRWRQPERILELATLAVVPKPGAARIPERHVPHIPVDMPPLAISSSLIRARARSGAAIRYLLPDPVADYITLQRLYSPL